MLRYYTADNLAEMSRPDANGGGAVPQRSEETVPMRLTAGEVATLGQLVEAGRFFARSAALAWLVREGMVKNQSLLNRVDEAISQIRAIKASVQ